ncbi:MAG: type II toxin-antitoxin system VapC family toxin [Verrucomicrobia bacterium]|nr:type II toxin-antitoxin system VapC family toxin [Verrucomicrobiota bacterium]
MLLDTNRYRDYAEGEAAVLDKMRRCEKVFLSFVSLAELRAGFACGNKQADNERHLSYSYKKPSVGVLFADAQTSHFYALLYRQLRVQGTPIPTNDLWIAALVAQHNISLYTRDTHFDHLPQLQNIVRMARRCKGEAKGSQIGSKMTDLSGKPTVKNRDCPVLMGRCSQLVLARVVRRK